MAGIRKTLTDLSKLLFLGVGISDPGTIPRKIDLWKIAAAEGWKLFNRSVSNLHYKGREAVRFDAGEGEGLALYSDLELSSGKVDLSIAGIRQRAGLIIRAKSETDFEVVCFDVVPESKNGLPGVRLSIQFNSTSAMVELPAHFLDEWISIRVVLEPQFTAVFVNGSNMPSLKVPAAQKQLPGGKIGLWNGSNSEALVADLKYIQSRKKDFEGI
jgi:hypothetical protein